MTNITKILFNGNRIIFDGHADTSEECLAITAMCDSMANDENFKTIIYEKGHAVFERVSGGESAKFETLKTQVDRLEAALNKLQEEVAYKTELTTMLEQYVLKANIGNLPEGTALVEYINQKTSVPMYKLPFTANELVTKLEKI